MSEEDYKAMQQARWDAHERVDGLMMNRRAQIVNGIGRDMAWRVKIEPNGALWVESHDIKVIKRTHYLLDTKGIDKGMQWTPLPSEKCQACLDKWSKAGWLLK